MPESPRPVRVGLVGCGKIAETHARALSDIPGVEWVACCDRDRERATSMANRNSVSNVFGDAGELFASGLVEAVMVCTPHPAHEPVVVAAANAGVHVLCEKPVATTLAEADRMIAAAASAGVHFGTIFQRRFWPAAQRIRSAIDDGKLGRITLGECTVRLWRGPDYFAMDPWRGKWATEGGGILMNQAVHSIDHFQWFMGRPVEVFGRYATLRHGDYIDVEDTAVATVVFENGALGTINASSTFSPAFGFRIAIHGDSGAMVGLYERHEGEVGVNAIWSIPGEEADRERWFAEDDKAVGFPSFHRAQIAEFIDSVREDRTPAVTGAEARKSLEIILAIYESSRTGKPVRIDP